VFSATPAYNLLRSAIEKRMQVTCIYKGHQRFCCPHAIGTTDGVPRVLVFQFGGTSSSGLPPAGEWRCMDIPSMIDISVRPGQWFTGDRHTKRQTCVKVVDLDITMA
jgi:hypothetical protein